MKLKNIILSALLLCAAISYSQVVINEYSASNLSGYTDDYNKYEDWIELYNTSNSSIDISGYFLSDNPNNTTKWEIPEGTIIAGNGYITVWCSGRDENSPWSNGMHSNFKLKQTKAVAEHLVLSDASENVINDLELRKTQLEHSIGRSPNGASTFKIFTSPTLGGPNNTSSFEAYAATPEMSLDAGFYNGTQSIAITTSEPNSLIKYSVNGNLPNGFAPTYSSPITINDTKVIKAIVTSTNPQILPSFIDFNTYFINEDHSLPVISSSADELTVLLNGSITLRPFGTIEYFNADGEREDAGYGEYNKHGQDSWQFDQRSLDYIARDEMGYHAAIDEKLIEWSDRESYQKIIIRASGDDNYPGIDTSAHTRDVFIHNLATKNNMKVDMRRGQRCVMYANGQFWGVYSIREKVSDSDYTDFYYGQDKYNIQYLMNWGNTWAQYGGSQAFTDWNTIHDFALDNDLSVDANYQHVADEIDVESLTDYILINSFVVCTDWINWNTSWWRGLNPDGTHTKWGYVLWDEDATFNHYINYTNVPNENPDADPCYPEGITADPEEQIVLLNRLLENETFRQYYITRYMDLMNTVFTEEEAIGLLEDIESQIAPEMPKHIQRWGGSVSEWEDNVQKVKDFILDRINFVPEGLNACYDLTGPYEMTLNVEPEGAGQIHFNSLTIDYGDYPWTGTYHGGIDMVSASVQSNPDYIFDHWEIQNQTLADPNASNVSFQLTENEVLTAVFVQNNGGNEIIINEINYKDSPEFEVGDWIELYNNGDNAVNVSNYVFKDEDDMHEFVIPLGTIMQPNSYLVLVESLAEFQVNYGSVTPVYGDFGFSLSGDGELLRLFDANGTLIDSVLYNDQLPWPTEADGDGPTLELINPDLDNSLPESWSACAAPGNENGTPGAVNNDCSLGLDDAILGLDITVVPNPMSNQSIITIPNNTDRLHLQMFDMQGRQVRSLHIDTETIVIDRNTLDSGIYLIKIATDSNVVVTKKLIIE